MRARESINKRRVGRAHGASPAPGRSAPGMKNGSMETGPGRIVVTLGAEALIDAAKLAALVQRSKGSYRLTPDMKLVARINEAAKEQDLIAEAKKVLRDLSKVALPQA